MFVALYPGNLLSLPLREYFPFPDGSPNVLSSEECVLLQGPSSCGFPKVAASIYAGRVNRFLKGSFKAVLFTIPAWYDETLIM